MIIPLIIGNAIFAIICVVLWVQYSSAKRSYEIKISELNQRVSESEKDMISSSTQMRQTMAADNKKIEALNSELNAARSEISLIRKEKEEEIKLRMEAEKQIALAIHKAEDIQKRMYDWKAAQEAAMKDSQNTIIQVGEDLYQKINASHQAEIANNKALFDQVTEYIKKATSSIQNVATIPSATSNTTKTAEPTAKNSESPAVKTADTAQDLGKKLAADLVESMKDSNHVAGEKYFTASNFDADKAKMFLCESAFINDSHLYIFDFKACAFLQEYTHNNDKAAGEKAVIQKLDKYAAYLSNPKYRGAILKTLESKNVKFENSDIIATVPSHVELEALERMGYLDKLEQVGIKVATFDELIDLTL